MKPTNQLVSLLLIWLMLSCTSDTPVSEDIVTASLFTDMSHEETGIDFRNDLTDDPTDPTKNVMDFYNYYNGGGVAVGDFNNDGLEDLVFSGNEVPNRIYLNKGGLKFEDITQKANINQKKKWTTGVMVVDINSDGYDDIYFCQSGPFTTAPKDRKNLLFINNGDLTFTERAEEYGLADSNISEQAVFFDMDKDGDLDCFVLNNSIYVRVDLKVVFKHLENKKNLEAASSNLYRNDNGKFVKVTEEAGMLKYGFGLSAIVTDINGDGWLDIYQSNDYSVPDFMYINQKDGTFKDEIKDRTKNISWFSMGADIADFNNDGHVDIAVVDMAATDHVRGKTLMAPMDSKFFNSVTYVLGYQRQHMFNSLQLNNGDGTFNNLAGMYGLLASEWSWAALFADFDNDGWKDYFVSNGFRRYARDNDSRIRVDKTRKQYGGSVPLEKRKELYEQIPQVKIPNYTYKNIEGNRFEEVGESWGVGEPSYSNGAAYADLDNDGDLELIINDIDGYAKIYRNNSQKNYLRIKLDATTPLEGTRVTIKYGDQIQMQEYNTVRGFQSSMTSIIHFGLDNLQQVDEVEVSWMDGKTSIVRNVNSNQTLLVSHQKAAPKTEEKKNYASLFKEQIINFIHKENEYNDYALEVLVPYAQSTLGPFISKSDVNGDGLEDFFIGGAKGQGGRLFIQQAGGLFNIGNTQPWNQHKGSEDMGSHFFDADGDQDMDLYIISSGNDFNPDDPARKDRLYLNDGKGNFRFAQHIIPDILSGGSKVKSADMDGDGDLDLFIAGRLEAKNYPNPPRSYLLENTGGKFEDVTEKWSADLLKPGLVNDFLWTDVNNDNRADLILVGEWMPVRIFINNGDHFSEESDRYLPENLSGWNYSIESADIDQDGDLDLVVGNLGLNSKFSASKKKPFKLMADDFDGNGTCDIVLAKEYKGKTVPVRGRECSSEQMPFILDKFKNYNDFAHASIEDILGEEKIRDGLQLKIENLQSGIYYNNEGKFEFKPLPIEAQRSVINGIEILDLNEDGKLDIIVAGNLFNMEIETPPLDGSEGLVLLQREDGSFKAIPSVESNFKASGDVKDLQMISMADGSTGFLVANNNSRVQLFKTID